MIKLKKWQQKKYPKSTANSVKDIVPTFINALNKEDFDTARDCLSDDMIFDGVLGHRDGADTYINDMKKMSFSTRLKNPVKTKMMYAFCMTLTWAVKTPYSLVDGIRLNTKK